MVSSFRRFAAAAFALFALGAGTAQAAPPAPAAGYTWQQAFGDEFDGLALDPLKWNSCYWWVTNGGCTNTGNGELQWYTPGNVVVSNGTVKLRARKETVLAPNGNTYAYTSGLISTGRASSVLTTPPKFQFKYGYMEMRAKTPAGAGLWSTFWTLPSSHTWPPEIDVMETRGDRPTDVHVGVYNKDASGSQVHGSAWLSGIDHTAAFHTYAVNWQPTFLSYYVDGIEKIRVTDPTRIPSEPMYVLANLAVGGGWPGAPTDATPFPSDLEIDYIHVFELKTNPADPVATAAAAVSTTSATSASAPTAAALKAPAAAGGSRDAASAAPAAAAAPATRNAARKAAKARQRKAASKRRRLASCARNPSAGRHSVRRSSGSRPRSTPMHVLRQRSRCSRTRSS